MGGKLNFGKIFKLFDDKHSADLYDRQVAVVTRAAKLSAKGFWLADLDGVCRLVEVLRARLKSGIEAFEAPLSEVLQLCGEPFQRAKANEMMASEGVVSAVFATLGSVVCDASLRGSLRQVAADALLQITSGRSARITAEIAAGTDDEEEVAMMEERRPQLASFNQRLLDRCGVLRAAVGLFADTAATARMEATQQEGGGRGGDDDDGIGGVRFGAPGATSAGIEGDSSDDDEDGGLGGESAVVTQAVAAMGASAALAAAAQSPLRRLLASLLSLTRELSAAPQNTAALTACGAAAAVVDTLAATRDFRDPLVSGGVEILWNLLEHADRVLGAAAAASGDSSNASRAIAASLTQDSSGGTNPLAALQTADAHGVMCALLQALLQGGFRQADKELRNELLIVATLLASQPASWPLFRQSGLLDVAVTYASDPPGPDTGEEDERKGDVHNYGTCSEEDFELKQLLWGLVCALCERDAENLEAVAERSRFLQTLVASVQEPPALVQAWGATQLKALQLQALSVLAGLATQAPERFSQMDGMSVAVQFVQSACSLDILDNPAPDLELRGAALKLILHTSGLLDFPDQLGELGAVEAMLSLFSDTAVPIEMRRDALAIIACVCRGGHEENQTVFRKAGGVEALRDCLRYDTSEAVNNNFLIVAVVDAVWSVVVGNRRSEARLLHLEGVEALLDLLEVCPALMRNQVLGVMADLCRNARAPPRFRCWKSSSSSMATAAQLLLGLWVTEEGRLNVTRVNQGLLNSLETPLGALAGQAGDGGSGPESGQVAAPTSTNGPSPAFARLKEALAAAKDMSRSERALQEAVGAQDMRCKIFAVLQSVGFEAVADDLAMEERMTFATACNYPEFRRGQEWLGVKEELRSDGCNPIAADALLIESKLEQSFDLASATKCQQQLLLGEATQQGRDSEKTFFSSILQQREQELQAQRLMQKAGGSSTKPSAAAKKRLEAQKKKAANVKNSSSLMSVTS